MAKGKLLFKYGTMNSGKSLQLLATAHNFSEKSIPFILMKSSIDDREGGNTVHSRALGDMECHTVKPNDDIFKLISRLLDYSKTMLLKPIQWILVDEAQFMTESQIEQLAAICDNYGINVICYGLRTDFQSKLFPGSKRLFELADSIDEIKSSCSCGCKTIINARVDDNGNIVSIGEQVEIGGNERYVSMCRKCYFDKTGKEHYNNKREENE